MTTVPLLAGGSHESTPEYAAVSVFVVTFDAVPVSVAVQSGVGSPAPCFGKTIVVERVVPLIVPENVPVLFR